MKGFIPVNVSSGAFNFCKYTIAAMLWISLFLQNSILLWVCFALLVLSAILKVKRAPLVVLYSYTIDKLFPSKRIILEQKSIAFAHTVGAIISLLALLSLRLENPLVGWILVGVLAFLKTTAAFGYCGAAKLYTCLNNPNGQCCRVGKKVKAIKDGEGFK